MTEKEFVTCNRQKLAAKLIPGSIAVLHANDMMPTNADGTMKYKPNNDVYWLSGIRQEETVLMLFPSHPDPNLREVLFIKKVGEDFVKWHGKRLSLEEAGEISGINTVKWSTEFTNIFSGSANYADHICLNAIEHSRTENEVQTRDDRFRLWCMEHYPLHHYGRLAPVLAELRKVKSEFELKRLQTACDITEKGFRRMLKFVKPGTKERLIEAELIHEYIQHDGDWSDYQPIVASGANTCILHYITNREICRDGDLLLVDAAASYELYNADLTRTIPVNGRYTTRQKQVYNAVLNVHKAMKDFAKAGTTFQQLQAYSSDLLIEQLASLGLFTSSDLGKHGKAFYLDRYCYHGFSHLLGLDVHDVGHFYQPLPENTVITIEPGIYIKEENIGVRIENNVVVKAGGTFDLMRNTPIEAEEIEELMHQ